jgi:hypothetical protein
MNIKFIMSYKNNKFNHILQIIVYIEINSVMASALKIYGILLVYNGHLLRGDDWK